MVHSYSSIDNLFSPVGIIVYYRLKQIDLDGKGSYSKIVTLKTKRSEKNLLISPNPFKSYLNVNLKPFTRVKYGLSSASFPQ